MVACGLGRADWGAPSTIALWQLRICTQWDGCVICTDMHLCIHPYMHIAVLNSLLVRETMAHHINLRLFPVIFDNVNIPSLLRSAVSVPLRI
jgi:hypothetical protein